MILSPLSFHASYQYVRIICEGGGEKVVATTFFYSESLAQLYDGGGEIANSEVCLFNVLEEVLERQLTKVTDSNDAKLACWHIIISLLPRTESRGGPSPLPPS